ncbi:aminotransferase class I/II-fold pyridoxal phosphate-dependent enzyme [Akkermansiaceae bacterium]|nr:aminotransferase class I/II-fold pyridoxal phosphate-dependent enzyme [Akkermansiaceae bacterium]
MDYSKKIAHQVAAIPRSGIRDFFELVQGRDDVISLGVGEPDFDTPWHIREAAIYSLEKGQTSYTSNLGLLKLRGAITSYVESFFNVSYDPKSEVIVTVGVSEAIDLALRALLNPGDEVIYHEPCYVSYSPSIVMAHGVAVPVATNKADEFSLKAESLEKAITEKSRVLMLNFPTNPTGATATRKDLEEIAALCIKHDIIVLTDEIYSELRYDEPEHISIASIPGMKERTILLHGFSKAFAMTGFRLGYACAPAPLTDAMMKIHQYSMLCAPITSQVAALEALENGLPEVEVMKKSYKVRRDLMVKRLNEMGIECHLPGGAFYIFPDIRKFGLTSMEFATQLLEQQSVAAVPGCAFGTSGEGFLRCCYATSLDEIKIALDKIEIFIGSLK